MYTVYLMFTPKCTTYIWYIWSISFFAHKWWTKTEGNPKDSGKITSAFVCVQFDHSHGQNMALALCQDGRGISPHILDREDWNSGKPWRGSETRTTSFRIKWSKQCPSAEWQKQIVTIYSNLQYNLTLQGVHQNRLVLVWGCLRHTSRLIDFIHCHPLWKVQPGFVSLTETRESQGLIFSQRARSESSDPHKLQPHWTWGLSTFKWLVKHVQYKVSFRNNIVHCKCFLPKSETTFCNSQVCSHSYKWQLECAA